MRGGGNMSSEIYYNKAFIKVDENQYLPMIQSGSSNCWEYNAFGRAIPEKKWYLANFPHKNKYIFTKEEIFEIAKKLEQYSSESSAMKKTRNKIFEKEEFGKWFKAGIKSAKTIDDYISFGNEFTLSYFNDENKKTKVKIINTENLLKTLNQLIVNENIRIIFEFSNRNLKKRK